LLKFVEEETLKAKRLFFVLVKAFQCLLIFDKDEGESERYDRVIVVDNMYEMEDFH
jgi:hypothetical protein